MTKILLIDDDLLMKRMYQKMFAFENYELETAFDGEEGLEIAKRIKPMLILLDIMMPRLNGFQVLDKLKLDPETKNMPVIMLTNLIGQQDAQKALSKGAIKYIVKLDTDPKQVVNTVKETLVSYAN